MESSAKNLIKKSSKKPEQIVQHIQKVSQTNRKPRQEYLDTDEMALSQNFQNLRQSNVSMKSKAKQLQKIVISGNRREKALKHRLMDRIKHEKRQRNQRSNLSLIRETESEQSFTNSSQNTSFRTELSEIDLDQMDDLGSQTDRKQKFINLIDLNDDQERLNRTMVKSSKKTFNSNTSVNANANLPSENQRSKSKKQSRLTEVELMKIAQRFQASDLHAFNKQGLIQDEDYIKAMNIKKGLSKTHKQQKLNQNFKKIQSRANIIIHNYTLIREKVQNCLKQLFDQADLISSQTEKQAIKNSEKEKLQIQTMKRSAQIRVIHDFLVQIITQIQQFQKGFALIFDQIDSEMKSKGQKVSENLIFRSMKPFLQEKQLRYQQIIRKFKSHRNQSYLEDTVENLYLQSLEQKFSSQLQRIEQKQNQQIKRQGQIYYRKNGKISEQVFEKIKAKSRQETSSKLKNVKEQLQQAIEYTKMVRFKGQLKEGKILQKALIMVAEKPLQNQSSREINAQIIIGQFKFYKALLMNNLMKKAEILEKLFYFYQGKKQKTKIQIQHLKGQKIETRLERLHANVNNLSNTANLFFSQNEQNSKFSLKRQKNQNWSDRSNDCFEFIEKKKAKLQALQKKKSLIFNDQSDKKFSPQSRLIFSNKKQFYTVSGNLKRPEQNSQCQKLADKGQKYEDQIRLNHKKQKPSGSERPNILDFIIKPMDPANYVKFENEHFQTYKSRRQHRIYENRQRYIPPFLKPEPKYVNSSGSPEFKMALKPKIQQNKKTMDFQNQLKQLNDQEIEKVCEDFACKFVFNPQLCKQLDEKQFSFLMSPEYRRHFLQKRNRDKQLTGRILNEIRANTVSSSIYTNSHESRFEEKNLIPNMIKVDPYFQSKIEQYQTEVVKSYTIINPNRSKLGHQSFFGDSGYFENPSDKDPSRCDLLEKRLQEIQKRRCVQRMQQKLAEYGHQQICQYQFIDF